MRRVEGCEVETHAVPAYKSLRPLRSVFPSIRLWLSGRLAGDYRYVFIPRYDVDWYGATFLASLLSRGEAIGYSETVTARKREYNHGFDALLTRAVAECPYVHEALRNLHLLDATGIAAPEQWKIEGTLTRASARELAPEIAGQLAAAGPYIVIAPGAAEAKRQWPAGNYAVIARRAQSEYGLRTVIVGSAGDREAGLKIAAEVPGSLDLTGRTSVGGTLEIMEGAELFIGNDSGPGHLSAAAGTPAIILSVYAPSTPPNPDDPHSPDRFRPWGVTHRVLTPERPVEPCVASCCADEPHCIATIPLEAVAGAFSELWNTRAGDCATEI